MSETAGDARLRVSDAERNEVTEALARHYADGRLDRSEFDERVGRALSARTRADLDGLLAGLPVAASATPRTGVPDGLLVQPGPRPGSRSVVRRGPRSHRVLFLVAVVLLAGIVGEALARTFPIWAVIAVAAFLWMRHRNLRRR